MGCPAEVTIGTNFVFSVVTHDPDTSGVDNADSLPTYRIYEDETATPILTGTLSRLDSGNTTAFYTELVACSIANGFEPNKTYTILTYATVNGTTGGITFTFRTKTGPFSPSYGVALANLPFVMVDSTDLNTPKTGVTVTARISKDGAAFAACTNLVSEIGNGWYHISLTAAEMTALTIALKFTGTSCAQRNIAFITQPNG